MLASATGSADPFDQIMTLIRDPEGPETHPEVVLAGSAGTGKTTLMKRVVGAWGPERATLLAPTGKAARRLTEATGFKAATLHSTIYGGPTEHPDTKELIWRDPQPIGGEGHLVVVDEMSMVGLSLMTDLRVAVEPGTMVLLVGDPFQLPPVNDAPGVDLTKPDVRLTVVHRSGEGIMRLAYAILAAKSGPELSRVIQNAGAYPGVFIPQGITPHDWRAKTQIAGSDSVLITYRNASRHSINAMTRGALGYNGDLRMNEPLVVMSTNQRLGIANGELLRMMGAITEGDVGYDVDCPLHMSQIVVQGSMGPRVPCYTDSRGFLQDSREWRETRREDTQSWRYRMDRPGELRNPKWRTQAQELAEGNLPRSVIPGPAGEAAHLHLGYALTCHKMQGSEAENVGIVWAGMNEQGNYWSDWWALKKDLEMVRAWWYTAVTRTKKNLIIWK